MKKKAGNEIWQLTDFGVEVKKRMVERNMKMCHLAQKVGMSSSFLSQVLYGVRKGNNYIDFIKKALDIKDDYKNAGQ